MRDGMAIRISRNPEMSGEFRWTAFRGETQICDSSREFATERAAMDDARRFIQDVAAIGVIPFEIEVYNRERESLDADRALERRFRAGAPTL